MRKAMIAGNWKMNTTVAEGSDLAINLSGFVSSSGKFTKTLVVICPPFTHLSEVVKSVVGSDIAVGAQNVWSEEKGAYTGEISAKMLAGLVKYVIIGHSERRQYFGETNELVNKKTTIAMANGLLPIVCVGELLDVRQGGDYLNFILNQARVALTGQAINGENLVIAYEPVWAIGTGLAASKEQAEEVIGALRNLVNAMFGAEIADKTLILYGGSTTEENIAEYMAMPDIDGALVGGASLKTEKFTKMIAEAEKSRAR